MAKVYFLEILETNKKRNEVKTESAFKAPHSLKKNFILDNKQ